MPRHPANPHRLRVTEVAKREGLTSDALIQQAMFDSVVFACCTEGCEVEPDGTCEHGCPSVLVALGMI